MSCSYLYFDNKDNDHKLNPVVRIGHICEPYGKYILVWGGQKVNTESTDLICKKLLWILDTEFEKWVVVECNDEENVPMPLSGMSSTMLDCYIYLFGGSKKQSHFNGLTDNYFNDLFRLNLRTLNWEKLSPNSKLPSPRDKSSGWSYKNKLYFFGGFGPCFNHDEFLSGYGLYDEISNFDVKLGWNNQLICYDLDTEKWELQAISGNSIQPRAAHTCTKISDNQRIIFGGRTKERRSNDLFLINLDTFKCTENLNENISKDKVPVGRSWHTMVKIDGDNMFLYGGLSDQNEALGDGWLLSTNSFQWTKIKISFETRLLHSAATSAGSSSHIYIIGGSINEIFFNQPKFPKHALKISLSPESLQRTCIDFIGENMDLFEEKLRKVFPEIPKVLQRTILSDSRTNFVKLRVKEISQK